MIKFLDLFIAVVAFYFTVPAVKSQAVDCTALANDGDCDFYIQCVEARFQCGANGYPLAYGDRYCRQFEAENDCFTSEGQAWIRNTRICLMKAILSSQVYQSSETCAKLETLAFDSHPSCYTEHGFCSDIFLNITNLYCTIFNVFRWEDFFNRQAIQQVFETATRCTRQAADRFLFFVDGWTALAQGIKTFLQIVKELLGGCKYGLDIMLVLDASGSIGDANFITMKNFIANQLIPNFNIGAEDTRVGVIRFSSTALTLIPLGSINNATLLQNSIINIYYTGGGTRTDLALNDTISAFSNARASEGIPRVVIVFTDGQSNEQALTAQAAQLVHDAGISVYSFGIGSGIDMTELNTIASDAGNVFQIAGFSAMQFTNILLQLETAACTTPAIVSVNDEPLETSLEMGESRLLQYSFPAEEGMTLIIDVTTGKVLVLGSFTVRNPTSLTADFSVYSSKDGINYHIGPDLYQASRGSESHDQRRRRQANSQLPNNATADVNVYLSIMGLLDNNTFSLNTTFGDTVDNNTVTLNATFEDTVNHTIPLNATTSENDTAINNTAVNNTTVNNTSLFSNTTFGDNNMNSTFFFNTTFENNTNISSMNTTLGSTSAALGLKTVYQILLFAVLFALMTLLQQ